MACRAAAKCGRISINSLPRLKTGRPSRPLRPFWGRLPMPDLNFTIERAEPVPYAVAPTLNFSTRVTNIDNDEVIQSVMLRCQIQTTRRKYEAVEQARLRDIFVDPERWAQTLKTMLWTHADKVVQQFTGSTSFELPVPCTFDFNIATTKYFAALAD